jgi:hypothetical protein
MSVENSTKQDAAVKIAENQLKIIIGIRVLWISLGFAILFIIGVSSTISVNQGLFEDWGFEYIIMFIIRWSLAFALGVFGEWIVGLVGETADLHEKRLELVSDPDSK